MGVLVVLAAVDAAMGMVELELLDKVTMVDTVLIQVLMQVVAVAVVLVPLVFFQRVYRHTEQAEVVWLHL
jgi:uncharacterized membrane protein YuzA (DUF378 family)